MPELEFTPVRRSGGRPSESELRVAREEAAALRRQRAARGPATELSLFGGAPAVGNSFVFVVDRSRSMGSSGLGVVERAKLEFQSALAGLEPVHRFQIVAYNDRNVFFTEDRELCLATEPNKQLVDEFMGGLAAFGATNHFAALSAAPYRRPDVLFLLTDGGDPVLRSPQMAQVLRTARGHTTIHCLQFGRGGAADEDNFMQQLARDRWQLSLSGRYDAARSLTK